MAVFRSIPSIKIINGVSIKTSDLCVITNEEYTTNGESAIVVREIEKSKIILDHKTTDHITIKSMTDVTVESEVLIDDEHHEIQLNPGSSIELRFVYDRWYIMSSDGIKD
jgi:hypothetical protein